MRVADDLNAALHDLLDRDPRAYLLGEDVLDPYGGAFKITRGLSGKFPGRVLGTPISEGAITGMAAGLALAGDTAVVEIMFGDFVTLAFDQIVNFAAKSVTMYGKRLPMRMIVRCPSGGGRGYGPTHSQSPQKHLIGVPGLALYEVSPFHDNRAVFTEMLDRGEPCVLFEDKILYTRPMFPQVAPFRLTPPEEAGGFATVSLPGGGEPDCVIVATGGTAHRALAAMRALLLQDEITATLLVPSRLYPFDFPESAASARAVFVVEESTAGGTWGAEVAHVLHSRLWGRLSRPVELVHTDASVIPTASHLEERVLVSESSIHHAIRKALRG
ncbi:transketolase C-terminal domain-containing protein [Spongiactinospora sp. TRM90649]|uniref:alpha-ketoacid dehydrogenase subunit beta n=1 Tax=Spongiactinospora sp. TRM90649 TaxID=3031114 RepID=UPI0023F9D0FB|nr:transketolase C-terminal domain-containing protein [Spongiactinospora sp. TRM90649]MDF5754045.1 transketolase C-terminal domain-containing protein [Spongiactinospora sp. TRM90649]